MNILKLKFPLCETSITAKRGGKLNHRVQFYFITKVKIFGERITLLLLLQLAAVSSTTTAKTFSPNFFQLLGEEILRRGGREVANKFRLRAKEGPPSAPA